ncbi:MAG: hypothetical protein ACJ789_14170 [Thermomicrobiales bacterium]
MQILKDVNDLHDAIIAFAASLLIPVPFLLAMLVLHQTTVEERRFWTHAAVLFAAPFWL